MKQRKSQKALPFRVRTHKPNPKISPNQNYNPKHYEAIDLNPSWPDNAEDGEPASLKKVQNSPEQSETYTAYRNFRDTHSKS